MRSEAIYCVLIPILPLLTVLTTPPKVKAKQTGPTPRKRKKRRDEDEEADRACVGSSRQLDRSRACGWSKCSLGIGRRPAKLASFFLHRGRGICYTQATMAFKRLELPPPRVLLLVLSAFLGFLALEGFLLWAYRSAPLRLSLLDLLFWGALMLWSVSVRVPLPLSASMSQFFIFALALVALTSPWVPPLLSFLLQWRRKVWYKELFNSSQNALATALAALVWQFFQQNPLYLGSWDLSAGVGIAAASLAFFLANTTLVTTAIHLANDVPWHEAWRKNFS